MEEYYLYTIEQPPSTGWHVEDELAILKREPLCIDTLSTLEAFDSNKKTLQCQLAAIK